MAKARCVPAGMVIPLEKVKSLTAMRLIITECQGKVSYDARLENIRVGEKRYTHDHWRQYVEIL